MRAYSTDLRERIVAAVAQGRTHREAARVFGVAPATVRRYLRQRAATGRLAPKASPGGRRRIGPEREALLRARLEAAPAATLAEHRAWWTQATGTPVSVATLWRAIRRLGWTRKKRRWRPASATRRAGRRGAR